MCIGKDPKLEQLEPCELAWKLLSVDPVFEVPKGVSVFMSKCDGLALGFLEVAIQRSLEVLGVEAQNPFVQLEDDLVRCFADLDTDYLIVVRAVGESASHFDFDACRLTQLVSCPAT